MPCYSCGGVRIYASFEMNNISLNSISKIDPSFSPRGSYMAKRASGPLFHSRLQNDIVTCLESSKANISVNDNREMVQFPFLSKGGRNPHK